MLNLWKYFLALMSICCWFLPIDDKKSIKSARTYKNHNQWKQNSNWIEYSLDSCHLNIKQSRMFLLTKLFSYSDWFCKNLICILCFLYNFLGKKLFLSEDNSWRYSSVGNCRRIAKRTSRLSPERKQRSQMLSLRYDSFEISGSILGIASSLIRSSSVVEEGPSLICFMEKLSRGHGPFVFALICCWPLLKYFKLWHIVFV